MHVRTHLYDVQQFYVAINHPTAGHTIDTYHIMNIGCVVVIIVGYSTGTGGSTFDSTHSGWAKNKEELRLKRSSRKLQLH